MKGFEKTEGLRTNDSSTEGAPRSSPLLCSLRMLLVDAVLITGALFFAVLMRFDGALPAGALDVFPRALPLLLTVRLVTMVWLGLHRWSFRRSGINEAVRLVMANVVASIVFEFLRLVFFASALPGQVVALEFFAATTLLGIHRFAPRMARQWYLEQRRSRADGVQRTLIVGAGSAGDLLLRDLMRGQGNSWHVIGLVDDDPGKQGTFLNGKPVLGVIDALPELMTKHRVTQVLIAIPRLSPERTRHILSLCRHESVSFKIIPASFAYLDEKITAAMLHDLSPEHLLPRDAVSFDHDEVHRLVSGRRVLVTGGAGSIGSEITRQLAGHAPSSLVVVDINENELYLLVRQLQARYPGLPVSSIVADIRDLDRMMRIGQEYRPQYVFHAAAHKHVPLMEDSPEEAIKNNVFGTQNVARMADACGAERFVLISTDKAVKPSSVMGASKRLAEMVIQDIAVTSRTTFCAVRFGNVLGSAGSVVPLFKQQIQAGGPVTVTHPDCTRYFMIIPEAVGLVVLAGLSGYGELCILDMGAPVRIAELAANMITMTGRVPDKDISIVYTGLRPGEKLEETLMSDEEELTQQVRNRIKVARSPAPPQDFDLQLLRLERAAHAGDVHAVKSALQDLIPSYTPSKSRNVILPGSSPLLADVNPPVPGGLRGGPHPLGVEQAVRA
ncbi:polysaccharide biosynthesis protein [Corallococcus praedator]|uniref:Polysaccharide biosynthesis protein n=1 Tax=Corallococcus praedator TaxID=2316724 RepID=A0ABX9QJ18_9BACT|nr:MULTISPECIES: nucleoside-diphosphate sugar epimerase/dehydratase [Corallococcus]RKH12652.1 polysaccharide biosynthesis protein [Corallococcus sp. CA047B]RKH27576.1 polysaccharide biosynthesis protein [Corallococcus sp. CA031C]RKI07125.1 polysaccharide biosynthesis protein [Corallococcus praedator]